MSTISPAEALATLQFDNRFTSQLPADTELRNFRRPVQRAAYSRVNPTPVPQPVLIGYAREVGDLLDLQCDPFSTDDFAQVFSGNRLLPGMDPFAMCYGGHQFGHWAGQLGDGRAINLGEVVNRNGEHWTLQLKGAGPTPYSRTADGLAVLRSSVREFLCSEAMHHLGVPTTRALSLVLTGQYVVRDMFYDGNPKKEPGAVVCRVAPSFTRFGNFQIFASRGDASNLRQLVDSTIRCDYPQLGSPSAEVYSEWFAEICRRTAVMIVHWMRVGFVHGVMNTDNMSILGLTIDYGPYGWLEDYDPGWTPNTTDAHGRRYCFAEQPQVALWNLMQLAESLEPLLDDVEPLNRGLETYRHSVEKHWQAMIAQKLGFGQYEPETDGALVQELFGLLPMIETDMTIFFRRLSDVSPSLSSNHGRDVGQVVGSEFGRDDGRTLIAPLADAFYVPDQLTDNAIAPLVNWLRNYIKRLQKDGMQDADRRQRMHAVNPKYVLRNYLAQLAIDKAEAGDASIISELLDILRKPYDEQPEREQYAAKRPEWARHRAGCSMLSCSS